MLRLEEQWLVASGEWLGKADDEFHGGGGAELEVRGDISQW